MKKILFLLLFSCVNLAAQPVENGVFAVVSFERKIQNKTETYYWIAPQDSILSHDNGRFCLYPLYLAEEEEITWTPLLNGNGDAEYCSTNLFCKIVRENQEVVQRIQSVRNGIVYKRTLIEKRIKETITVSLSFVSGSFFVGLIQTDNVINKGFPLKAYSPAGKIETVFKQPDDRVYLLAKTTDYQGIAFSIIQLASSSFDREISKAYQAPYQ